MPKVLQIVFEGHGHRFVKLLDVPDSGSELVVRTGDQTLRPARASLPGRPRFELPDDAQAFEVHLRLADPDAKDDIDRDFERFTQGFTLPSDGAPPRPVGRLNARFVLADGVTTSRDAAAGVYTLHLDLTFLDVRARLREIWLKKFQALLEARRRDGKAVVRITAENHDELVAKVTDKTWGLVRLCNSWPDLMWDAASATFPPTRPSPQDATTSACVMHLLEFTTDTFPPLWGAVVPPAVRTTEGPIDVFVFMCPWDAYKVYTNPDRFYLWNLNRYALSTPYPETPYYTLRTESDGPGQPPRFETLASHRWERPLTACAFAEQLRNTKRPIVLLFPMPGSVSNGPLSVPAQRGRTARDIIVSALRALQRTGDLRPRGAPAPVLRRLGIGGFSDGARATVDIVRAHPDDFDVCCLFDPIPATQTAARGLRGWLEGRGVTGDARTMVLVPTWDHAGILGLARALPKAVVLNDDPAWAARSPTYLRAFTARSRFGFLPRGATPRRLPPSPDAPGGQYATEADEITGKLGIYFEREDGTGASLTLSDGTRSRTLSGLAHHEAAAVAYFEFVKLEKRASLDVLVAACNQHSALFRHQWAVVGGQRMGSRGDTGFFQLCLEHGYR